MADEMEEEWFCKQCPMIAECSWQSWDRCGDCASRNSYEECWESVERHLKNSAKHWERSDEERAIAMTTVEIDVREVRKRPPPDAVPPAGGGNNKRAKHNSNDVKEIAKQAAKEAAQEVMSQTGASGSGGPDNSPPNTLALFNPRGIPGDVVVSRQQFQTVVEALNRNKRACKSALAFFEAGVTAFREELRTVDDCIDVVAQTAQSSTPFKRK